VADCEGFPRQAVGCGLRARQSLPTLFQSMLALLATFGQGIRALKHMASSGVRSGACCFANDPQMEKLCSEAHGLCGCAL